MTDRPDRPSARAPPAQPATRRGPRQDARFVGRPCCPGLQPFGVRFFYPASAPHSNPASSGMTVRLRIVAVLALVASLAAGGRAPAQEAPAQPPSRVVSFNICTDQLVVALADPGQIAGLSPYATDPTLSAVADQARAFR